MINTKESEGIYTIQRKSDKINDRKVFTVKLVSSMFLVNDCKLCFDMKKQRDFGKFCSFLPF